MAVFMQSGRNSSCVYFAENKLAPSSTEGKLSSYILEKSVSVTSVWQLPKTPFLGNNDISDEKPTSRY